MNIGYVQFAPALNEVKATIQQLEALLPKGRDADLLVLPELCNSGYNFATKEQAFASSETIADSLFLAFLGEKCRQFHFDIVVGFNEREGGQLYNSSILIGKNGIGGRYRKIHLFDREKEFFQPGNDGLPVFNSGTATIGMLICFDWIYPEVWRILALKGADIICHPANLILPGLAQRAVPIHALTNRIYVVTGNRIGSEGELHFTGGSLITDPRGQVLSSAPEEKDYISIESIEPAFARDKVVTPLNDLFKDRRPDEYSLLTESEPE